MALLEARPYRPFKSSEEYLEAMKEDLAEWLSTMYPDLLINAENFMDRLDTGVALCKHANFVRQAAEDYLARRQARNKSMTRSMTSGLAGPILAMGNVHYLLAAKSGTFFARDNVSNFITWCRKSLKIIECLLFETDDLIMRKNEKHVILCLLEVARRGAKFGMLAPMLVQMERQIDREIAADNKANGIGCGTQTDNNNATKTEIGVGTDNAATETDIFDTDDSDNDDDVDDDPVLMYGPQPQIITNDLKSLDEMVRDLVEKCTCPSQFPMVRVSEGKYRIGDTKVLIFVRILRSHVMVRVGGGWDTLSHYLDKHDPCRCRSQHRSAIAARLIPRTTNNPSNGIELHKAQVIFERSPPTARKIISNFNNQAAQHVGTTSATSYATPPSTASFATTGNANNGLNNSLSPNYGVNKNRSRSPTPQRKYMSQLQPQQQQPSVVTTSNVVGDNNEQRASSTNVLPSSNLSRRSMSPSPRRLMDIRKKQSSLDTSNPLSGPKSLPIVNDSHINNGNHVQFESLDSSQSEAAASNAGGSGNAITAEANTNGNKFENISDNGSEISDEGYRSLGLVQSGAQKRESIHSQASMDDAETNARLDQTSSDSQLSPTDEAIASNKTLEHLDVEFETTAIESVLDCGPQSLPAILSTPQRSPTDTVPNKFEQSGIFITDEDITVDIASATGLRKTGFSNKIFGIESSAKRATAEASRIPCSPVATRRRRSIDNSTCASGSLQDLNTRTGLPVFNRRKPVYRSVRQPQSVTNHLQKNVTTSTNPPISIARKPKTQPARDITNTWNGARPNPTVAAAAAPTSATAVTKKSSGPQRSSSGAAISATATTTSNQNTFERNGRTRSSQILYDSNGRRIKGCTASLTTSPVKHATSPLAQQLLEAASSAKNDAQILEKMKTLLSRYATSNQQTTTTAGHHKTTTATANTNTNTKKPELYEDFTSAWVHSNGNLERSSSCSPPTKTLSKRSSAASSTDSTNSRDIASVIVSPRRERGVSKIPAPMRRNTELY